MYSVTLHRTAGLPLNGILLKPGLNELSEEEFQQAASFEVDTTKGKASYLECLMQAGVVSIEQGGTEVYTPNTDFRTMKIDRLRPAYAEIVGASPEGLKKAELLEGLLKAVGQG